jgi:hypothetical protein
MDKGERIVSQSASLEESGDSSLEAIESVGSVARPERTEASG